LAEFKPPNIKLISNLRQTKFSRKLRIVVPLKSNWYSPKLKIRGINLIIISQPSRCRPIAKGINSKKIILQSSLELNRLARKASTSTASYALKDFLERINVSPYAKVDVSIKHQSSKHIRLIAQKLKKHHLKWNWMQKWSHHALDK